MLTRGDIHDFLESVGIRHDNTVLVHTSMRSLGEVEGGCDGLIDSFTSYLSDGLFIVPTHTWANVGASSPVYDVRRTETCIGALPNVAAFRTDGVRSLHPTHSVAAFGKDSLDFVRGEENATSPCWTGGVWQRLYDRSAVVLLIGVGLDRNTYFHAIDEMIDLPGRLTDPIPLTVIGYLGEEYKLSFRKHGVTGSRFFENFRAPLEATGAMFNGYLGGAKIGIIDTVRTTEVIKTLWARAEYNLCGEAREIPEEYYSDLVKNKNGKTLR